MAGWRGLGLFWIIVLVVLAGTGGVLQYLGPPAAPHVAEMPTQPKAVAAAPQADQPHVPVAQATSAPDNRGRPGRGTPGPIADPDPGLLEQVSGQPANPLPRISTDGRMPMQVYAAGFDRNTQRPKVGLILAGFGLNQKDSDAAVHTLPGGITFAVSPYAADPTKLLAAARAGEHEFLLSIPMEPQGFPLNDAGNQALMTNLPPDQNARRLDWALSRFAGYVGATGALGSLRGERLAAVADQLNPVLSELAARGLLYVDPRQGAAALSFAWSRGIDLVIDEPPDAAKIDDKLAQLSRIARDKGSALGLAGAIRPVTTQRIAAWASGLTADGLALTPVSALVEAPQGGASK
jgi:polysaccharide deacetylase 2 family uncharacterized protein YibQ